MTELMKRHARSAFTANLYIMREIGLITQDDVKEINALLQLRITGLTPEQRDREARERVNKQRELHRSRR